MINNAVKKLEENLVAQDGKINLLQKCIASLEQQVKKIEELEEKVDDCEQYSQRLCVRVDNMAVRSGVKEDCLSKVVELMSKMDSNLSEDSIDRAHRMGPKIVSENGTVRQQMIVRFKTFSDRTKCYLKLQLHDAIYRLRSYSNSLIHVLSLSNSHNNVASLQRIGAINRTV